MPYLEKRHKIKYRGKYRIEVEQYHSSMYGNHECRAPKTEITQEQVEEINRRRASKWLRRTILLNFEPGDIYWTFTYRKGERASPEESKKHLNRLMGRIKYQYKKRGIPFKWIKTTGISSTGKAHHHVIVNRVDGIPYHELIQKYWTYGKAVTEYLYEQGDFRQLAEYFVKHKKENKQVDSKSGVLGYSCSRNLKRSNPRPTPIKESKIRKLPKIPRNFTLIECEEGQTKDGYLYRYYTLEKIEESNPRTGMRKRE